MKKLFIIVILVLVFISACTNKEITKENLDISIQNGLNYLN